MRFGHKPLLIAHLVIAALALAACGGTPTSSNWGGGSSVGTGASSGSGATYTIGGTITGLSGNGLVLLDNGTDNLTINATGTGSSTGTVAGVLTFAFTTAVSGAYNVTIQTQPTNPIQSCNVTNGSGTATANVTNVAIICTTSNTVGGTVTGLLGTGLVLEDNGGNNLTVTGSGTVTFTFLNSLANGAAYNVTVGAQPINPNQTCTVANGSGTITSGSVTSVQVACSQPKYSVSGIVSGLIVGAGDTVEVQDNAGDNLFVTGDVPFEFPTQFTYGTTYSVNVFLQPASQPGISCNVFNATAVITATVNDVDVDCQHNDWAWMFPSGTPAINQYGNATLSSFTAGSSPPTPPFSDANPSTPGGRDFAMTWTDKQGDRWLFGGYGFEVTHQSTDGIPGLLNDMWVWPTDFDGNTGWWEPGGWVPADLPITATNNGTSTSYTANITPLQIKWGSPVYGSQGTGTACSVTAGQGVCTVPGARWGGVTWTDANGNLWMFGGQGQAHESATPGSPIVEGLLNDVWEFDLTDGPCQWDVTTGTGTFTDCTWIWQNGSNAVNQPTTGTFPGARWGALTYTQTDASGNPVALWMLGGQGYDSTGTVGLLNDLWEYNISTSTWTLVCGTTCGTTLANQNGVYGTEGTAASGNMPGGRQNGVMWVDTSGNIWIFGGWGLDSIGTTATGLGPGNAQIGAILNDLWKFNPGTGKWTWVSGSSTADQNGMYGTEATSNAATNAAATNVPGSRWGSFGWTAPDGDLFLFGGFGYGSDSTQPTGFLNDVWEFDQASGQWIWWKGSIGVNQPSTYTSSPVDYFQLSYTNNAIGARRGTAFWQPDSLGYVWAFGGQGYDSTAGGPYGDLNDLWRYLPFP